MKLLVKGVNSLVASVITTLFIVTISFMIMLFSSAKEGYRTSYFGSLFFNNYNTADDTVKMEFGVANGTPIIITFILLSFLYFLLFLFHQKKPNKSP